MLVVMNDGNHASRWTLASMARDEGWRWVLLQIEQVQGGSL